MTDRELDEVNWVYNRLNSKPAEFPDVSTKCIKTGLPFPFEQANIRWLRYYAFCRHHVACMKMCSYFATQRNHGGCHPNVWGFEVQDTAVDLRFLYLNSRLVVAEKRKAQRKEAVPA